MEMSKFHIHTIGKSAVNKEPYTPLLEVFPIETMSYVDGEITDAQETTEAEGEDAFGQSYTESVKSSNTLRATWFPFGSNRLTPPDIRRGERVLLWRYADTDQYYWTTTGLDDFLRRLETVVYAWSDTTDESVKKLTIDNSYYVEVSTHKQLVTFSTCKSNGEPFAYKFQFNTKKGIVILMDDIGNYIELDSKERSIVMRNADDSILSLDKTIALLKTDAEINLVTKAYTLKCTTADTNASSSVSYTTPLVKIKATTLTGTIDAATFSGTVNVAKLLTMAGGLSATAGVGATASIAIPLSATDGVTTTGGLTNNGTNVGSAHTHISGAPGSSTSTPS